MKMFNNYLFSLKFSYFITIYSRSGFLKIVLEMEHFIRILKECLVLNFENCFLFSKARRTRKTVRICLISDFLLL